MDVPVVMCRQGRPCLLAVGDIASLSAEKVVDALIMSKGQEALGSAKAGPTGQNTGA